MLDLEQRVAAVRARHVELLAQVNLMEFRAEFTQKNAIDSLYLAGEYEDTAAQLLAEASEIENKSYTTSSRSRTKPIHHQKNSPYALLETLVRSGKSVPKCLWAT